MTCGEDVPESSSFKEKGLTGFVTTRLAGYQMTRVDVQTGMVQGHRSGGVKTRRCRRALAQLRDPIIRRQTLAIHPSVNTIKTQCLSQLPPTAKTLPREAAN